MVSGGGGGGGGNDVSPNKGAQFSVIEESYIIKEWELQLRSRYDRFISSK